MLYPVLIVCLEWVIEKKKKTNIKKNYFMFTIKMKSNSRIGGMGNYVELINNTTIPENCSYKSS